MRKLAIWWKHQSGAVRLALVGGLLLLFFQLWPGLPQAWQFSRNALVQDRAWWLLLTSQWVHLGWAHTWANVVCMGILVLALEHWVDERTQWIALLGGHMGVALVLVSDTQCAYYAGASGNLHGLLAGSMVGLLIGRTRRGTAMAIAVLLIIGLKLWWQRSYAASSSAESSLGWLGLPIYYFAHEAGALGGVCAVLLYLGWRWYSPRSPFARDQRKGQ